MRLCVLAKKGHVRGPGKLVGGATPGLPFVMLEMMGCSKANLHPCPEGFLAEGCQSASVPSTACSPPSYCGPRLWLVHQPTPITQTPIGALFALCGECSSFKNNYQRKRQLLEPAHFGSCTAASTGFLLSSREHALLGKGRKISPTPDSYSLAEPSLGGLRPRPKKPKARHVHRAKLKLLGPTRVSHLDRPGAD